MHDGIEKLDELRHEYSWDEQYKSQIIQVYIKCYNQYIYIYIVAMMNNKTKVKIKKEYLLDESNKKQCHTVIITDRIYDRIMSQ